MHFHTYHEGNLGPIRSAANPRHVIRLFVCRWQSLTALNLSGCGLAALSSMVGGLGGLLELRLSDNKLTALPRELGLLRALRVLVADNNLLTALPGRATIVPFVRLACT